jgi:putative DNA methylase
VRSPDTPAPLDEPEFFNGIRRKLIEVSLPLEAINAEASRRKQKSPKGYPTNIHKWWAQIPVAAARGVLFAQLVDDPGSWPESFPSSEAVKVERDRLHELLGRLVLWEAKEETLAEARWEIARSLARASGQRPPPQENAKAVLAWLADHAPPVLDPFSGGGTVALEAQRLGLKAIASDLNPIAVLTTRALVEIPPRFARRLPVYPEAREKARHGGWQGGPASGLAEDLRRYGAWMREEAFRCVGHLYPDAMLPDGSKAKMVAWLWARTVRSQNPVAKGAMVPLISSFLLSSKEGRQVWLEPIIDPVAAKYNFAIRSGERAPDSATQGLKTGRSAFRCILTGAPIDAEYIDKEANAGRLGTTMVGSVALTKHGRLYLPADVEHEKIALSVRAGWKPHIESRGTFASNAQGRRYGFRTYGDYFTPRQLLTLTTFADLVAEVRTRVLTDATDAGLPNDARPLAEGGGGPAAYADAVATYIAITVSRLVHYNCALCRWLPKDNAIAMGLPDKAIPMVWDFVEGNPFGESSSEFLQCLKNVADCLDAAAAAVPATVRQGAAQDAGPFTIPPLVSTDPPYYNNVLYSELSDFFYGWLRRMLAPIYPDDFRPPAVPKAAELVANPYRHGSGGAEAFFLDGMRTVLRRLADQAASDVPMTIYYAYKQSEKQDAGVASTGWATFLQALHDAGLILDGTWPLRTQNAGRLVARGANALASAIILSCRRRPADAPAISRGAFLALLRAELPPAARQLREDRIAATDFEQAIIGPGMAVFTRHSAVLEADDTRMPVKTALALINQVLDEEEADVDPATRFALTWFATYGFDERPYGDADNLARARDVVVKAMKDVGLLVSGRNRVRLRRRDEWADDFDVATEPDGPAWMLANGLARALDRGGEAQAAALLARLGARAEPVRDLAYRLFLLAERKKLSAEAGAWNALAVAWPDLVDRARAAAQDAGPAQAAMAL